MKFPPSTVAYQLVLSLFSSYVGDHMMHLPCHISKTLASSRCSGHLALTICLESYIYGWPEGVSVVAMKPRWETEREKENKGNRDKWRKNRHTIPRLF